MSDLPFSSLPLKPALLATLNDLGFTAMTQVQAASLPAIIEGRDVLAQAKTGSGKTAAFGLGLLNRLNVKRFRVQSLVLCPTRELADQVAKELRRFARGIHNIKILTLCGGVPVGPQIGSLEHGAHIIVGTPGRVLDHLQKGRLDLGELQQLVLDEADRMLEMGFADALEQISAYMPDKRQSLLFSATFPEPIAELARAMMDKPLSIKLEQQHDQLSIAQQFIEVTDTASRLQAVEALLLAHRPESAVVFCNTKKKPRSWPTAWSNRASACVHSMAIWISASAIRRWCSLPQECGGVGSHRCCRPGAGYRSPGSGDQLSTGVRSRSACAQGRSYRPRRCLGPGCQPGRPKRWHANGAAGGYLRPANHERTATARQFLLCADKSSNALHPH